MNDVDGITFLNSSGSPVSVDLMERNATMAMILISRGAWLQRTSGPTIIHTEPGGVYVHTTREQFTIDFRNWFNENELANYDLVSSAPDNPLTNEERRDFYMDTDYTYYHMYTNLFWAIRDKIIRGQDEDGGGILIYEGETLDGQFVGSGKFFLNVEAVKNGNIEDTIEAIAATFVIKVHEKKKKGFWQLLLGALVKAIIGVIIAVAFWLFVALVFPVVGTFLIGDAGMAIISQTVTSFTAALSLGTAATVSTAATGLTIIETVKIATTAVQVIGAVKEVQGVSAQYADAMSDINEVKEEHRVERANYEVTKELAIEEARLEQARKQGIMSQEPSEEEKKEWDPFYALEVEMAKENPVLMLEQSFKGGAFEDHYE